LAHTSNASLTLKFLAQLSELGGAIASIASPGYAPECYRPRVN